MDADLCSHKVSQHLAGRDRDARPSVLLAGVVADGHSYGGDVVSDAAAGQDRVTRLLYVASVPRPVPIDDVSAGNVLQADPHLLVRADGTFVLDDQWWLTEELGATLPTHVQEHLWQHRRRPVSTAVIHGVQVAAAWETIPTTVLLGRLDDVVSEAERDWALARLADVRMLDTDHFILFRQPDAIADVITEALDVAAGTR